MPMAKQTHATNTRLLITLYGAAQPMVQLAHTQAEARCKSVHTKGNQLDPKNPELAPHPSTWLVGRQRHQAIEWLGLEVAEFLLNSNQ